MNSNFSVTLNGRLIYSYSKKSVPARLRRFLDEMDLDMTNGVVLGDDRVDTPDDFQKLQYIAMQLFHALDNKDLNHAEVMSAYLMSRSNNLSAIIIESDNDIINLKLSLT